MKQGGVNWNQSVNHNQGVRDRFICSVCGRNYKMQWARNNHQKLCKEFNKSKWKLKQ